MIRGAVFAYHGVAMPIAATETMRHCAAGLIRSRNAAAPQITMAGRLRRLWLIIP
jgi:hypothetical protein